VLRYGGFGDAIQTISILPWLKEQGYHITMYTVPNAWEVIKHDPHIDDVILQDVEQIPNYQLGEFWAHTRKKYEKWVNLSESIERTLLALPGNIAHGWPHEVRHARMNVNYMEFIHAIAEVPLPPRIKFYPTAAEESWARGEVAKLGGKVILWLLSGSAVHKTWAHFDGAVARITEDPSVHVILCGDKIGKKLEEGWEDHPQVHCWSGKTTIRESMAMAQVCDLVVGPETGVLNAIACEDVPKVVTMSHSSVENLTRDWVNCVSLTPANTSCYPCHQLHFSFEHCRESKDRPGVAACQFDISEDSMVTAIEGLLWSGK
jgi:ADP-heptose:LPS heptosyltransferase